MNEHIIDYLMDIEHIKQSILSGNYDMSLHAIERALERNIWKDDIEHVIIYGEIIEEYVYDKPYPSCLIFGKDTKGYPLHVVCAFSPIIKIITVYYPDESKWIDYRRRK